MQMKQLLQSIQMLLRVVELKSFNRIFKGGYHKSVQRTGCSKRDYLKPPSENIHDSHESYRIVRVLTVTPQIILRNANTMKQIYRALTQSHQNPFPVCPVKKRKLYKLTANQRHPFHAACFEQHGNVPPVLDKNGEQCLHLVRVD